MKILYEHQAFTYQSWGGVSKSFCELIANRPEGTDYDISLIESNNLHILEYGLKNKIKPITRTFQTYHQKYGNNIWGREKVYRFLSNYKLLHTAEYTNQQESIRMIKQGNFDLFHPTFFDTYFLPHLNGKPFVLTVHDLMPELFGWYKDDPQIKNKPVLLEKASAIIAVSKNTKNDLCRLYDVPEDKVHVIYHGMPEKDSSATYQDIINAPYFLYVGGRGGYKNYEQTIIDFSEFHKSHPEVKYVFTGAPFSEQEQETIQELRLKDNIEHIFASEYQLACLYSYAIAFVYPSLYEGFGMPILEAFAYGCPVLLNNKSCFPEIGGNAALYFESENNQSNLVSLLNSIYNASNEERLQIVQRGKERLEMFSWKKSAKKLYDVYRKIM